MSFPKKLRGKLYSQLGQIVLLFVLLFPQIKPKCVLKKEENVSTLQAVHVRKIPAFHRSSQYPLSQRGEHLTYSGMKACLSPFSTLLAASIKFVLGKVVLVT